MALPAVGLVTLCSQKKSSPFRTIFPQVDPDNGPAVEPDDDEDIEQGEAEGRDDKHFWNWDRLHMALGGNAPIDHICDCLAKTPLADEVEARYDLRRENIRIADYRGDMALVQLK